jgi:hypothetical protein
MMNNIYEMIKNAEADAKAKGGDFLGATVNLNVKIGADNTVPIRAIHDSLKNNPNIPREWLPKDREDLSLYLGVITSLNKNSERSFNFPPDYPKELKETFNGYTVTRLWKNKDDQYPCGHRIFYKNKVKTYVDSVGSVKDQEIEHSIMIVLERNELGLQICPKFDNEFDMANLVYFEPFIDTLYQQYQDRINGQYNSTELRKIILDVILNKIHARSLNDGLYFVPKDKLGPLNEFCETLRQVDKGISLLNFGVMRGPEGSFEQTTFQQVSEGISADVLKELKALKAELAEFDAADTTRASTWTDRFERLRNISKEVQNYRNEQMLISDVVDDLLLECKSIVAENL